MRIYPQNGGSGGFLNQPDPYLIKAEDGRYYLYATGGQVYSSEKLLRDWKYCGVRLIMPGQKVCWAPCVFYHDGMYYMYYSSMDEDCQEEHGHKIRVAVSECPEGPFVFKKTLLPPFSIDPHVVKTPAGIYLFYSGNDEHAERPGTRIYCDRLTDPFHAEGQPVCAVYPTLDEEIYQRDRFRAGEHWHTIEGAFYFFRAGTHYLMYSGACYQNPTYFIGYATAEGEEDADLRMLQWKKYPDERTYAPLLAKTSCYEGAGHNSVLVDDGRYYIVYHARDFGPAGNEDTRTARMDEMIFDGKKIRVIPLH